MEIAKEVINSFVDNYHSDRADIQVFVGPHIHDCHFEVKNDVSPYFPGETVIREGKLYVDLSSAVKKQLLASSISANHINISSECTHCLSDKYFSFRRDNPQDLETMISYIGLK
jgi:copper oxidase (laccase) domain-containing protein